MATNKIIFNSQVSPNAIPHPTPHPIHQSKSNTFLLKPFLPADR